MTLKNSTESFSAFKYCTAQALPMYTALALHFNLGYQGTVRDTQQFEVQSLVYKLC